MPNFANGIGQVIFKKYWHLKQKTKLFRVQTREICEQCKNLFPKWVTFLDRSKKNEFALSKPDIDGKNHIQSVTS
jgi:hypothetical protein